jgi:DNA-binding CsgD family transcriptional regulator
VSIAMSRLAAELDDLGGADITEALEDLPVPSFVLDRDGVIRWVNEAARAERGDTTGSHWGKLIPATQSREVEEILRQILCSGDPAELSIDLLDSDGRPVLREVSAAPLKDGDTVVGVFGVTARAGAGEPEHSAADLGLTERQLEVLKLLAAGKSTGQIADELFVSKTTVRNHIAHILARLEVHTRVQAVLLASRAGLVRMPPTRPAGGTSDAPRS